MTSLALLLPILAVFDTNTEILASSIVLTIEAVKVSLDGFFITVCIAKVYLQCHAVAK